MKKGETFVEALTTILQKQNAIAPDQAKVLKKAFFDRSDLAYDDFLLQEGLISRTELLNALSTLYQVPAFDVTGYFFSHDLLRQFPKDLLLRLLVIPLEREENTLIMIASNPNDSDLLSQLGKVVSYDLQFMVGLGQDISDAVEEFYDQSIATIETDDVVNEAVEEDVELDELMHPMHDED